VPLIVLVTSELCAVVSVASVGGSVR
jgi:hypothetical protein